MYLISTSSKRYVPCSTMVKCSKLFQIVYDILIGSKNKATILSQ